MSDILKRVLELEGLQLAAFFDLVFEDEANKQNSTYFLSILKYADAETTEDFYQKVDAGGANWLKEQIKSIGDEEDKVPVAKVEIAKVFDKIDERVELYNREREIGLEKIKEYRNMMKGYQDNFISDQMLEMEMPSPVKEYDESAQFIDLVKPDKSILKKANILDCISDRVSHRKFTDQKLTLEELSYLLWATQGVRKLFPNGKGSFRTVPSGGARQPFETYIAVNLVEGLTPGVYRYLPFEDKLVFLFEDDDLPPKLTEMGYRQKFVGQCAVCFIWAVIPYRTEWRYGTVAKKDMLQEAGHICQNLYLACESILCGTCGINAYDQDKIDKFLNLDGEDEFVVYLAPVGKV